VPCLLLDCLQDLIDVLKALRQKEVCLVDGNVLDIMKLQILGPVELEKPVWSCDQNVNDARDALLLPLPSHRATMDEADATLRKVGDALQRVEGLHGELAARADDQSKRRGCTHVNAVVVLSGILVFLQKLHQRQHVREALPRAGLCRDAEVLSAEDPGDGLGLDGSRHDHIFCPGILPHVQTKAICRPLDHLMTEAQLLERRAIELHILGFVRPSSNSTDPYEVTLLADGHDPVLRLQPSLWKNIGRELDLLFVRESVEADPPHASLFVPFCHHAHALFAKIVLLSLEHRFDLEPRR